MVDLIWPLCEFAVPIWLLAHVRLKLINQSWLRISVNLLLALWSNQEFNINSPFIISKSQFHKHQIKISIPKMVSQQEYNQFVKNLQKEALSSSLLEEPQSNRKRKMLKKCKHTVLKLFKASMKIQKSTQPALTVCNRPRSQTVTGLESRKTQSKKLPPMISTKSENHGPKRIVIPTIFVQSDQIYVRKRPFNPNQQFEVLYMCWKILVM